MLCKHKMYELMDLSYWIGQFAPSFFSFQSSGGSHKSELPQSHSPSLQSIPQQPKPYGLAYNDYSSQTPMKTYTLSPEDSYAARSMGPGSVASNGSYQVRKVASGMPEATYVRYDNGGTRYVLQ